ncbi:MAG: DUF6370 family protein [Verrucomicrobiota bacterium]
MTKLAVLIALSVAWTAGAADQVKTIQGDAVCAKCALGKSDSCQTAIQVKDGDKTVTYYAENNKVAKDFHGNICKDTKKVVATGTVKDVDGKKEIVLSKIEVEKE